jgi:guanosine-3',5'-bis(diphosphate) 3'-pyrophosphohydrolase
MINYINLVKTVEPEVLFKEVDSYCSKAEAESIRLAYNFAEKAHHGQARSNGDPYIIHPLCAAYILVQMRISADIVIAELLHDVPEDTDITIAEIEIFFGSDIANMIRGVTKLSKLKYRGAERYIENLRKMFIAMAEDIRVVIIKFADRIHNLLTLQSLPPNKRYRIALESLEIYAPIANRLGMGEFKGFLEDLSFPYVFPKECERVSKLSESYIAEEKSYLDSIMEQTKNELRKSGLKVLDIHGRKKKLYSLFQKLKQKNWEMDQIHDFVAIRVIVSKDSDCYAALGVIHQLWRPLKGRIKDFISQPKPNGYMSLHTTVFCTEGRVVEFQIRTPGMHEEAEFGIASHWHYDEKKKVANTSIRDISWAKELACIQKEVLNNLSDLNALKIDFFQNRIFVFTPNGDVIDLPENATPVDFAYLIHTDIGNKCEGALVNDQMVSLNTALKSGDVVEVLVDKNRKGPNRDWLSFVRTHTARQHIRQYLKAQKKNGYLRFFQNH